MNSLNRNSLAAIAVAMTGAFASAQISFQSAVNYPAGTTPDATAIGDLNGDGIRDIAVPTDAPDKVSLLFGTGNGVFAAPVNVALPNGSSPNTPVIGDLDGDGDMDIAVSLKGTNRVQILVNNGGTFTLGPSFLVGTEPRDMEISDLDNDGDLDLVTGNRSGGSVSVLRNDGSLAFTVTTIAAGSGLRQIAVGDVTGDGLIDIAVASHDNRQINVLRNTGGANFVLHATLSVNNEKPEGIAIARLDGNSSFDIVATADINNVEFAFVFLNSGNGSFGGATPYNLGGVLSTESIVTGDFDLDGDVDFATANKDSNNVSVLANAGNGTFGPAQLLAAGSQAHHITAGLLDGNGSLDLVVANDGSSNVSVFLNANGGSSCSATTYCQGKVNSQGGVAQIGSAGTTSLSAQNFNVTVSAALPNQNGLLFFGTNGPANTPFLGGTMCVAGAKTRAGIHQLSPTGSTSYSVTVTPAMVGTSRWYQFFYRDPSNPDGTGAALSNALRVDFCQ